MIALFGRMVRRHRYAGRHRTDAIAARRPLVGRRADDIAADPYVERVALAARRAEADWRRSHVLAVTADYPIVRGTDYGRRRRRATSSCVRTVVELGHPAPAINWHPRWAAAALAVGTAA